MELSELSKLLEDLDAKNRKELLFNVSGRKKTEMDFHDLNRTLSSGVQIEGVDSNEMLSNKKFYKTTNRSRLFVDNWITRNAKGRVVLDYACGLGELAQKASKAGASLTIGIDISPKSIDLAKQASQSADFDNIKFIVADAENTGLPDNSIDLILCSGMLHHLDLSYAFYEMRRILKPRGKILAVEALDINPFIKLYRILTPHLRTDFESKHILSIKELKFANRFFEVSSVKYWHIVGYLGAYMPLLQKVLDFFDKFIEKIPIFNRLAWQFTFELVKRDE